jgi:hypothetical protein
VTALGGDVHEVVRVRRRVAAAAQVLWDAVATPAGLAAWQADEVSGEVAVGRTLQLRYRALGAVIELDVVAVAPPSYLVLARAGSRLEITVRDGQVDLIHHGLTAGDEAEGTRSSWVIALATLAEAIERHRGERRHVHAVYAAVPAPAEVCHVFFSNASALRQWLLAAGEPGHDGVGAPVEFAWGASGTARWIASTEGRDVAFAWDEAAAVVALRTLPSPRSADERVLLFTTSSWGAPASSALIEGLTTAHRRLVGLLAARGVA